jgi:hypothetical protein
MPLVQIKKKSGTNLDFDDFIEVINELPGIVSKRLSAPPEGPLTPDEVEVWNISNHGSLNNIVRKDIEIIIFAHDYADRKSNLDERRQQIIEDLAMIIPAGYTFSVWVLLMPTSWGEAVGRA